MPLGLYLNYEEDFLKLWGHQVSRVFTDPLFLPSMANSVYGLATPPILGKALPFSAAPKKTHHSSGVSGWPGWHRNI